MRGFSIFTPSDEDYDDPSERLKLRKRWDKLYDQKMDIYRCRAEQIRSLESLDMMINVIENEMANIQADYVGYGRNGRGTNGR